MKTFSIPLSIFIAFSLASCATKPKNAILIPHISGQTRAISAQDVSEIMITAQRLKPKSIYIIRLNVYDASHVEIEAATGLSDSSGNIINLKKKDGKWMKHSSEPEAYWVY